MRTVQRILAALLGALLFCYPAYAFLPNVLVARPPRFPQNASSPWPVILGLGILYAAILIGVVFQVRQVRRVVRSQRVRGRDVFTGGLFGSVVVFLLGFFGPFIYAWATRTEAGNLAPLIGIFGFLIGLVISAGAALLAYGITGGVAVRDQRTAT